MPRKNDVPLEKVAGAERAPMPAKVAPMLASLTEGPFSSPSWLFETKLDGIRMIALVRGNNVKLLSRRGHDATKQYPVIAGELARLPKGEAVLDGEIVTFDEAGIPSFQRLQSRINLSRGEDIRRSEEETPVYYYVFDLLYWNGFRLYRVPLWQRKKLLQKAFSDSEHVRLIDYFENDGEVLYETAVTRGFEGLIAKQRESSYEPGKRTRSWLKIKATLTDEFIIGGYTPGQGSRARTFGALLLGYYDDNKRLVYAGHVGTGFDESMLVDLRRSMDKFASAQSPFAETPPRNAPVTWLRPGLVAEVKFSQWTQDGYLRAPVFLRLRPDKPPRAVSVAATVPRPRENHGGEGNRQDETGTALGQLRNEKDEYDIEVQGHQIRLTHLNKVLWPPAANHGGLTKRDFLVYLTRVSPYLLTHLRNRPLTLNRYPHGVSGSHFYQKHWGTPLPGFVQAVNLFSEHVGERQDYLICNNLATLLWLGQMANLELHVWFSRLNPAPELAATAEQEQLAARPDFIIFDIDPYIYSGKESPDEEPQLTRKGFRLAGKAALWLKQKLDSLFLNSFVKTSGRTGLHVYVPILRGLDYRAVHAAAETICNFVQREHPAEITLDWAVAKRSGKIFLDYNQNVRGKTLPAAYSPHVTPQATVATPVAWDEVEKIYPTDFTMLTVPDRLAKTGDLWAGILDTKQDLDRLLK